MPRDEISLIVNSVIEFIKLMQYLVCFLTIRLSSSKTAVFVIALQNDKIIDVNYKATIKSLQMQFYAKFMKRNKRRKQKQ